MIIVIKIIIIITIITIIVIILLVIVIATFYRPVLLHTKPRIYVDDITVKTGIVGDAGTVKFSVSVAGLQENDTLNCMVNLLDANNKRAIREPIYAAQGTVKVPTAELWWPRTMSSNPGYLYTLEVDEYYYLHLNINLLKSLIACFIIYLLSHFLNKLLLFISKITSSL